MLRKFSILLSKHWQIIALGKSEVIFKVQSINQQSHALLISLLFVCTHGYLQVVSVLACKGYGDKCPLSVHECEFFCLFCVCVCLCGLCDNPKDLFLFIVDFTQCD